MPRGVEILAQGPTASLRGRARTEVGHPASACELRVSNLPGVQGEFSWEKGVILTHIGTLWSDKDPSLRYPQTVDAVVAQGLVRTCFCPWRDPETTSMGGGASGVRWGSTGKGVTFFQVRFIIFFLS